MTIKLKKINVTNKPGGQKGYEQKDKAWLVVAVKER